MSEIKYIYAVNHANELIQLGYRCIGTGFNAKSQKYYWEFDYDEIQPYYENRKGMTDNNERTSCGKNTRLFN